MSLTPDKMAVTDKSAGNSAKMSLTTDSLTLTPDKMA